MLDPDTSLFSPPRDGSSQADRLVGALDPESAPVDEREPADLLAFLQRYAAKLNFYNLQNEVEGDWSAFLASVADPAKLAQVDAFLANPADFTGAFYDAWRRPHFALLLTFLDLLRPVRAQINAFTRRQLDFYYRETLGFQPRPAGSGQVHVLIQAQAGRDPFLLPAGTLLDAGRDPRGGAVHYQTDTDLVVTPAQVQQFRSLFLQRTVVGLDDVRRNPEVLFRFLTATPDWHGMTPRSDTDYPADKTFQALLEVALGDPAKSYSLPIYASDSLGNILADRDLYGALDPLLARVRATDGLALSLPTFRRLMVLRRGLDASRPDPAAQWTRVNAALQTAGQKKRANPAYTFPLPPQPDDFITNLKTALGFSDAAYAGLYDELPDVNDIYGLYHHLQDDAARQLPDDAARQFVTTTLAFASVDDFAATMAVVDGFYQQWQQVLAILRGAGRRKQSVDPAHVIAPPDLRAARPGVDLWTALLQGTLGDTGALLQVSGHPLTVARQPIATLDDADAAVQRLEEFFFMSADDFTTVRTALADVSTPAWKWDEVDAILVAARLGKETAAREAELQAARLGTTDPATGVQRMLAKALSLVNLSDSTADQAAFLQSGEATTLQQISAATGSVNWDLVASILNEARGRREKWQPSALQFESWDNLYAATDATALRSAPADSPTPRWRTFGDGPRTDGATAPAPLGFMIASPLLALAEGTRTITLTLEFTAASAGPQSEAIGKVLAQPDGPFRCLLSTAKAPVEIVPAPADIQWKPPVPDPGTGVIPPVPSLTFLLQIDEKAPPIAPSADPAVPVSAPFLQVLLRDLPDPASSGKPTTKCFEAFGPLVLTGVKLEVDVAGLTSLLLQNDDGDLRPQKPFEPFGSLPVAGSRFLFAHPEICTKQLDGLQVGFEWLGLPPDLNLANWYSAYPVPPTASPISSNLSFKVRLALYDQRAFRYLVDEVPLFGGGTLAATPLDPTATPTSLLPVTSQDIAANDKIYGPAPDAHIGDEPLDSDRYWFLELKRPDFFHGVYPQTAAQQATAKPPVFINPPYTPRVRRMFVNYQASVDLRLADNGPTAAHQLFYLEPFGCRHVETTPQTLPGDTMPSAVGPWLPQWQDADHHDLEGQLCIGVAGLAAPQDLSLLFQLAAGSADPDVIPNPILWHYLSGDQWLSLDDGHLLSDATRGLVNSGIVTLRLPVAQPSRRLPGGLYWIRLATTGHSRGVCDVIDVRTQAVTASLAPGSAAASGLVLAPNAITALVQSRPQVKAVQQPYSPFAARPPEEPPPFAARVSERLRHKGRALTCWDYERLILEAFPDVHRVKCLPVDSSDDPRQPTVRVIVIPDMRGKQPFDPFAPKAPADLLRDIEDFLAARCAAGTVFRVQNPRFCALELRFSVRLLPGCNPGFYFPQLNDQLCRFLSPWAYDASADIVFGGRVSANSIVYFIEQRPYVDYITDLKLVFDRGQPDSKTVTDQSSDLASLTGAPDVILVSAPQHQIDLISAQYVSSSFVGIDYMKIGLDFSVA